jgi:peptide/nickel transport system substrate-binding protein/oligopeptide transport system substrate-binding protein
VIVAAVLIVAAMLLAACGSDEDAATTNGDQGTPVAGGTYNFPLTANPVSIEPVNAQESEGMQVAHQVFQGLAKYVMNDKGEMEAVPDLAEKWETTDSQTWTFTLKQGVMYQAPVSREVKAQDFVDSWNYVTDPANQSYVSYILAPIEGCDDGGYQVDTKAGLTGVTAVDDYTLQVKLRYAFAEFPQTLGHTVAAAWPVDYAKEIGAKEFSQKPVGTGPYVVESWVNNQSITLVKNPDYWDTSEGAGPYIDTINMPIITSSQTEWLEFQKGTLDYTSVPPGQVAAAEAKPEVTNGEWTAKRWPVLAVYFIGMNMTDPTLGENAELRQAISMSTDAQNVINIVNEGVSLPAGGYVPEGIPGYKAEQNPYAYNPEEAKTMVDGMGGAPTLAYWYNTDEGHQKIAEVLQAGWQQAGIDVKLSNFEWGTFLDKLSKGNKGSGSQLFRMGWIADYPSMDNFLYPLFQSDQARTGSYTFYSNTQVDDLLLQARSTQDAQERYDLYAQAELQILTDMPASPLYFYRDFRVTNNRVANFVHNPMGFTDMWTLWIPEPAAAE